MTPHPHGGFQPAHMAGDAGTVIGVLQFLNGDGFGGGLGHRQRPVRSSGRAERAVGGCRVVAGFRFLAAEEPDRVSPVP